MKFAWLEKTSLDVNFFSGFLLTFGFCLCNVGEAGEISSHSQVDDTNSLASCKADLTSEQILAKVASAYAKCRSYKDSGIFTSETTLEDGSKYISRIVFHTALLRRQSTSKYRFAYRTNYFGKEFGEATILWHNGERTMLSTEEPAKFVKEESLGTATAGLTGLTHGVAHNIPALLMPNLIGGRKIVEVTALKPPIHDKIGEQSCYLLEGVYANDKVQLWIEKGSFLILKFVQNYTLNGLPHLQITRYAPEMNAKIPDHFFDKQVVGEWKNIETADHNESSNP